MGFIFPQPSAPNLVPPPPLGGDWAGKAGPLLGQLTLEKFCPFRASIFPGTQDRIFTAVLRKVQFHLVTDKNISLKFLQRFAPNVLFTLPNPEGTEFASTF